MKLLLIYFLVWLTLSSLASAFSNELIGAIGLLAGAVPEGGLPNLVDWAGKLING